VNFATTASKEDYNQDLIPFYYTIKQRNKKYRYNLSY